MIFLTKEALNEYLKDKLDEYIKNRVREHIHTEHQVSKDKNKECGQKYRIPFESIKDRVQKELFDRGIILKECFVFDGIFYPTYSKALDGISHILGPSVPSIMVIDRRTSETKFFALKALLPDLY